jgi:peptidoglycan/LPS O-acetylase OafA/YrhL
VSLGLVGCFQCLASLFASIPFFSCFFASSFLFNLIQNLTFKLNDISLNFSILLSFRYYHHSCTRRVLCTTSNHGQRVLNSGVIWFGNLTILRAAMSMFQNPFTTADGLHLPRKLLLPFLPSYFQHHITSTEEMGRRLHSTSALDGLRGIAALFVFFFHIGFAYQAFVEYGYGQSLENMRIIQLPFLSLFYRGHSMVAVFFVVGGYVLSLKPLTLIHSHRQSEAHSVIVSSIFRRGIRLYTSAVVITFITMLSVYAGLWDYPRQFITDDKKYIHYADMHPTPLPTFYEQFWDWLYATRGLTDVFNYYNKDGFMMPYYNQYDPHLWTVPFEYRSSLIVSMILFALSRCTTFARLLLIYLTVIFCGLWDRWELVCFLSGLLICDIDITLRAPTSKYGSSTSLSSSESSSATSSDDEYTEELPQYEEKHTNPSISNKFLHITSRSRSQKRWIALFVLGLYLLSTPNFGISSTPGYYYLSTIIPSSYTDPKRFLQSLGALLTTWAIANSSFLQIPFNSKFPQYLGKISYSLYVVHGPLIHVVGFSVTPWIWNNVTGMEGWAYWAGLGLGTLILGCVVGIAADLFHTVVDVRSVRLARWFEGICFTRE